MGPRHGHRVRKLRSQRVSVKSDSKGQSLKPYIATRMDSMGTTEERKRHQGKRNRDANWNTHGREGMTATCFLSCRKKGRQDGVQIKQDAARVHGCYRCIRGTWKFTSLFCLLLFMPKSSIGKKKRSWLKAEGAKVRAACWGSCCQLSSQKNMTVKVRNTLCDLHRDPYMLCYQLNLVS